MTDPALEPDRLGDAPHPRETAVLFGQEAAEARFLAAAAAGRLPHAWLITGPRGTGKATLAWRIARFLLGAPAQAGLALEPDAAVFRQVAALSHPGLFLCRRPWDDAGGRLRAEITVDEIRAMRAFFRLSAAEGGARVAIIDAAEEMNVSAANALLKLLEEPPAGAVLLLVSHRPARLLPTIRSRCSELRCRPLAPEALGAALTAAGATEGEPALLAELAGGSVGAAYRMLAEDGIDLYGEISELVAGAPPIDRPRLIALAERAGARGAESHYAALIEFVDLALGRLARAAAGASVAPVSAAEAAAFRRLACRPTQAHLWADAAARIAGRTGHARAVRLDPAQVILDIFLQLDATASEAASRAA